MATRRGEDGGDKKVIKNTLLKLDGNARSAILKGANKVYEAVRRTLGPDGANGLIFGTYGRPPRITNDGFAVSECVIPKDPFERLAAESFKEAAKRTNEMAGDGTTGTTVIAGYLLNDVLKKLSEQTTVIKTKKAVENLTELIKNDALSDVAKAGFKKVWCLTLAR